MNRATMALLVFLWGLLMGCLVVIAGCHTVHGVGHDLMDFSSQYVERDK